MSLVRTERDGPMAVITLDSPPLNLFDRAMTTELIAAIDQVQDDPPRGLLIRAEGKVVSGGVNVQSSRDCRRPKASGSGSSCSGWSTGSRACPSRSSSPPMA